jgi:hypothetical protein
MIALLLPVMLGMAALVVDVGHAFVVKRHLQKAADAAALAAAFELPNTGNATTVANLYSGSAGGHNENPNVPPVTTAVSFPTPTGSKVRVTQRADAGVFFARIFGFDEFNVSATAVAARKADTGGSRYAVFVHELCGASTGNKGLLANGKNMMIQGAIHSNGQLKVGDSNFRVGSMATVYRPPHADSPSPPGPTQGTCNGTGSPQIENGPNAKYCSIECAPGFDAPEHGPWQDWITPYHTETDVKSIVGTCTHGPGTANPISGDVVIGGGTIGEPRFYCLGPTQKFTISGSTTARITVIAGFIEINATGGNLRAFNDDDEHPLIAYSTNTDGTPLKVNPSGALDWVGYLINRVGGVQVNSGNVVSPRTGLIEAEWVDINGENFKMVGTGPPAPGTATFGGVELVE